MGLPCWERTLPGAVGRESDIPLSDRPDGKGNMLRPHLPSVLGLAGQLEAHSWQNSHNVTCYVTTCTPNTHTCWAL